MKLVNKAELFVTELFENVLEFKYTYHNINHTKSVVKAVEEIATNEKISEEDLEALLVAAWFHDCGYVECKEGHEEVSSTIVSKFLQENNCDALFIEKVERIILATVFDHKPKDILEKIICDADYNHLGKDCYFEVASHLRKEWELTNYKSFSDLDWAKGNLELLEEKHRFFTNYAQLHWKVGKEKNIKKIKEKIEEMEKPIAEEKETKKKKKKKNKKLGRGVETLFRVTINNHTRLSDIADSKANILLSVNAVIISVALSVLIPKLDSPGNGYLSLPTFVLLFFSVSSIIFAILSTRPKITKTDFTDEDVINKKVNLLFFGNFYKIPYDVFQGEINKMMEDNDYMYGSLAKDLHYLGIILERKYRLLRITYTIFMIGIIVSVLAFIYAYKNS
ncbi:Pycsar system effector family protein [Flavobacterium ponti]|jgi:predicted metal-dependent HD superfamily phosphohydrolase|uniref:Pycsar system effector family protein n=1 Tax=Flavobacterium ponti TaxID=665133 RepID=A0ABV9P6G1_9FLAO